MCSIIGSFNKNKILELVELNKHRGNKTYSISIVDPETLDVKVSKFSGPFSPDMFNTMTNLEGQDNSYYIVHIQAPTTKTTSLKYIHPAENEGHYLWHNGVIKSSQINRLQEKHKSSSDWDTELLLRDLISDYYIPNVDGGFACVLAKEGEFIRIFRTSSCPLFIDSEYNISSVKFDNTSPLRPDIIFELNLQEKLTKKIGGFVSKDNPYYFG